MTHTRTQTATLTACFKTSLTATRAQHTPHLVCIYDTSFLAITKCLRLTDDDVVAQISTSLSVCVTCPTYTINKVLLRVCIYHTTILLLLLLSNLCALQYTSMFQCIYYIISPTNLSNIRVELIIYEYYCCCLRIYILHVPAMTHVNIKYIAKYYGSEMLGLIILMAIIGCAQRDHYYLPFKWRR